MAVSTYCTSVIMICSTTAGQGQKQHRPQRSMQAGDPLLREQFAMRFLPFSFPFSKPFTAHYTEDMEKK